MWRHGVIGFPKEDKQGNKQYAVCHYEVKCSRWSKTGLNRSKILKLYIIIDDELVCHYDKKWIIEPTTEETKTALEVLLEEYS